MRGTVSEAAVLPPTFSYESYSALCHGVNPVDVIIYNLHVKVNAVYHCILLPNAAMRIFRYTGLATRVWVFFERFESL